MSPRPKRRLTSTAVFGRCLGAAVGFGLGAYLSYVGGLWLRYGRSENVARGESDPLLDRFIPEYEVSDRHHIRVLAPAATTFSAAKELEFMQSGVGSFSIQTVKSK